MSDSVETVIVSLSAMAVQQNDDKSVVSIPNAAKVDQLIAEGPLGTNCDKPYDEAEYERCYCIDRPSREEEAFATTLVMENETVCRVIEELKSPAFGNFPVSSWRLSVMHTGTPRGKNPWDRSKAITTRAKTFEDACAAAEDEFKKANISSGGGFHIVDIQVIPELNTDHKWLIRDSIAIRFDWPYHFEYDQSGTAGWIQDSESWACAYRSTCEAAYNNFYWEFEMRQKSRLGDVIHRVYNWRHKQAIYKMRHL